MALKAFFRVAGTVFYLLLVSNAKSRQIESLFRGPVLVHPLTPTPSLEPSSGQLWTVAWQEKSQSYVLSPSPDPSLYDLMLAHGTLSNDSVHRSGWWQLAIDTDRGSIDIERPPERQKSSKNDTSHEESLESKQRLKSQPTDEEVWDLRRWYAAGLLEGYMSAPLVAEYAQNAKHSLFGANHYPR